MDTGAGGAVTTGRRPRDTKRAGGKCWQPPNRISKKPENTRRRFKGKHEPSEVVGRQGVSQQDGDAGAAVAGDERSNTPSPRRGRQNWGGEAEERDAVYANPSAEERPSRSPSHASPWRDHREDLRPCAGDRRHATPCTFATRRNIAKQAAWCTCRLTTWVCSCASASALATEVFSRASSAALWAAWLHFGTSWLRSCGCQGTPTARISSPPSNHPSRGSLAQPHERSHSHH